MTDNEKSINNAKMESALKRVYGVLRDEFKFTAIDILTLSVKLAEVGIITLETFYTVEEKPVDEQIKSLIEFVENVEKKGDE